MKTQLNYNSLLIAALFIFANLTAVSQTYQISKTINKSTPVPVGLVLNISNHSGDIDMSTTVDNIVQIVTEVKVNAKSKEDADKLIKAIENFEFELSGETLHVNTRFYKNMQSTNGKTTLTLNNGDKIRIKDFSISHKVNMPKSTELNLENKYSKVVLGSLNGKAKLNLYNTKFYSSDFNNQVSLESKYSKLQVENFKGNTILDLYDSDIEFKTAENLKITSKYSKVEGNKTGMLDLESYDDNFYIDELSDLSLNAKYSDLKSEADLNTLKLELYDCNVSVGSVKSMSFNGKYCDVEVGDIETLKVDDSYDNNLSLGKTQTVAFGKSKYSKYILSETSSFSIDDSYDDNIVIKKLMPDFSAISLNGKYSKLTATAGSVPFKIKVNMKYGKVDIPESVTISKHIEKSGQLEMLAGTSGGTITVNGYDNTVLIK